MHLTQNTVNEITKAVIIKNVLGIHARPAAMISKLAQQAKSKILMIRNDTVVDATSIIDILMLECYRGTKLTLKIEDKSDIEILNKIVCLIESGFGE